MYVLYSAELLWYCKITRQETIQKFGCWWPSVSVIQPVNLVCAAHSFIYVYPDLELPYTSRIRVTLSRWMFSRIQGVVPRLFCFIHLFQSKYLMLCFKGRHWQNRLGTGPEQGAACSENQNVLWEISSTRCQFTSVNRLQTVKCYYLLFGGTWKVLHWICSLATIPVKQERCLLVCHLSEFLIALIWQWNKNGHDSQCDSEYSAACSPDFLLSHRSPFAPICWFVVRSYHGKC